MRNWIWHQKYNSDDAVYVSSYFGISNDVDDTIFKSELGNPIFKKEKDKAKIGFKYKGRK